MNLTQLAQLHETDTVPLSGPLIGKSSSEEGYT
jgi:hypothetical protein